MKNNSYLQTQQENSPNKIMKANTFSPQQKTQKQTPSKTVKVENGKKAKQASTNFTSTIDAIAQQIGQKSRQAAVAAALQNQKNALSQSQVVDYSKKQQQSGVSMAMSKRLAQKNGAKRSGATRTTANKDLKKTNATTAAVKDQENQQKQQKHLGESTTAGIRMNQSTTVISRGSSSIVSNSWQTHIKREDNHKQNSSWFEWLTCNKCECIGKKSPQEYATNETKAQERITIEQRSLPPKLRSIEYKAKINIMQSKRIRGSSQSSIINVYNESKDQNNNQQKSPLLQSSRLAASRGALDRTKEPVITTQELDEIIQLGYEMPISNVHQAQPLMKKDEISPQNDVSQDLKKSKQFDDNDDMVEVDAFDDPADLNKTELIYTDRGTAAEQQNQSGEQLQKNDERKSGNQIIDLKQEISLSKVANKSTTIHHNEEPSSYSQDYQKHIIGAMHLRTESRLKEDGLLQKAASNEATAQIVDSDQQKNNFDIVHDSSIDSSDKSIPEEIDEEASSYQFHTSNTQLSPCLPETEQQTKQPQKQMQNAILITTNTSLKKQPSLVQNGKVQTKRKECKKVWKYYKSQQKKIQNDEISSSEYIPDEYNEVKSSSSQFFAHLEKQVQEEKAGETNSAEINSDDCDEQVVIAADSEHLNPLIDASVGVGLSQRTTPIDPNRGPRITSKVHRTDNGDLSPSMPLKEQLEQIQDRLDFADNEVMGVDFQMNHFESLENQSHQDDQLGGINNAGSEEVNHDIVISKQERRFNNKTTQGVEKKLSARRDIEVEQLDNYCPEQFDGLINIQTNADAVERHNLLTGETSTSKGNIRSEQQEDLLGGYGQLKKQVHQKRAQEQQPGKSRLGANKFVGARSPSNLKSQKLLAESNRTQSKRQPVQNPNASVNTSTEQKAVTKKERLPQYTPNFSAKRKQDTIKAEKSSKVNKKLNQSLQHIKTPKEVDIQQLHLKQSASTTKQQPIGLETTKQRSISRDGSLKLPTNCKGGKMQEIYERYGKRAQIDLTTISVGNKQQTIVGTNDGDSTKGGDVPAPEMMKDALKMLAKSMRSESQASLGARQRQRSESSRPNSITSGVKDPSARSVGRRRNSTMIKPILSSSVQSNKFAATLNSSVSQQKKGNDCFKVPVILSQRPMNSTCTDIMYSDSGSQMTNKMIQQKDRNATTKPATQDQNFYSSLLLKNNRRSQSSNGEDTFANTSSNLGRGTSRASKKKQMEEIMNRYQTAGKELVDQQEVQKQSFRQLRLSFKNHSSKCSNDGQDHLNDTSTSKEVAQTVKQVTVLRTSKQRVVAGNGRDVLNEDSSIMTSPKNNQNTATQKIARVSMKRIDLKQLKLQKQSSPLPPISNTNKHQRNRSMSSFSMAANQLNSNASPRLSVRQKINVSTSNINLHNASAASPISSFNKTSTTHQQQQKTVARMFGHAKKQSISKIVMQQNLIKKQQNLSKEQQLSALPARTQRQPIVSMKDRFNNNSHIIQEQRKRSYSVRQKIQSSVSCIIDQSSPRLDRFKTFSMSRKIQRSQSIKNVVQSPRAGSESNMRASSPLGYQQPNFKKDRRLSVNRSKINPYLSSKAKENRRLSAQQNGVPMFQNGEIRMTSIQKTAVSRQNNRSLPPKYTFKANSSSVAILNGSMRRSNSVKQNYINATTPTVDYSTTKRNLLKILSQKQLNSSDPNNFESLPWKISRQNSNGYVPKKRSASRAESRTSAQDKRQPLQFQEQDQNKQPSLTQMGLIQPSKAGNVSPRGKHQMTARRTSNGNNANQKTAELFSKATPMQQANTTAIRSKYKPSVPKFSGRQSGGPLKRKATQIGMFQNQGFIVPGVMFTKQVLVTKQPNEEIRVKNQGYTSTKQFSTLQPNNFTTTSISKQANRQTLQKDNTKSTQKMMTTAAHATQQAKTTRDSNKFNLSQSQQLSSQQISTGFTSKRSPVFRQQQNVHGALVALGGGVGQPKKRTQVVQPRFY